MAISSDASIQYYSLLPIFITILPDLIEIDGGYHNAKEQHDYDEDRIHELQSLGIKVIRFSNSEVLSNSKKVINAIKDILRKK